MKTIIKEIRKRLQDAVDTADWWTVKSQINKLDTIIYNDSKIKIETTENLDLRVFKTGLLLSELKETQRLIEESLNKLIRQ